MVHMVYRYYRKNHSKKNIFYVPINHLNNWKQSLKVANEHDYIPFDILLKNPENLRKSNNIGCFKSVPYPTLTRGRKLLNDKSKVTKPKGLEFKKTKNGTIYESFQPTKFVPNVLFRNKSYCQANPFFITKGTLNAAT